MEEERGAESRNANASQSGEEGVVGHVDEEIDADSWRLITFSAFTVTVAVAVAMTASVSVSASVSVWRKV